jgi:hypothetical protein
LTLIIILKERRNFVKEFVDPQVGAVQGRVVVLNEPQNIVTRLVALERIGGYRVDQEARDKLGLIAQFGVQLADSEVGFLRICAVGIHRF